MEWKQENQPLNVVQIQSKLQSVEGKEKTFSLSSEIEPNMTEWAQASSFTCTSIHNTQTFMKTTSICQCKYVSLLSHSTIYKCKYYKMKSVINVFFPEDEATAPPSIDVEIPSFKKVMTEESPVKATCFVRTVLNAKVTWLLNETDTAGGTVRQDTKSTHLVSELTVSSSRWKQLKSITCQADHKCFSSAKKTVQITGETTTRHENQTSCDSMVHKRRSLLAFLSVSSRACRYRSID